MRQTHHIIGSKTIREFRRPVFSSTNGCNSSPTSAASRTGSGRPELKANRLLRLYPEEEGEPEEDVSSLSASQIPAELCPALNAARPSMPSGFYTDLSDDGLGRRIPTAQRRATGTRCKRCPGPIAKKFGSDSAETEMETT